PGRRGKAARSGTARRPRLRGGSAGVCSDVTNKPAAPRQSSPAPLPQVRTVPALACALLCLSSGILTTHRRVPEGGSALTYLVFRLASLPDPHANQCPPPGMGPPSQCPSFPCFRSSPSSCSSRIALRNGRML